MDKMVKTMGPFLFGILLISLFAAVSFAGNGYGRGQQGLGLTDISALPIQDVSDSERAGLLLMREEEKLARDVYLALYERWKLPIFNNIADSEQQHMDAVALLLERYDISDPVSGENAQKGVFADSHMQELYDNLLVQGEASLVAALTVGATIEDLDIKDLYELIGETDNQDITRVYQNLAKGSRNHLRSFAAQLSGQRATYKAQYLSQEQVDKIIASPRESGLATD
jgi:hypothetical protein